MYLIFNKLDSSNIFVVLKKINYTYLILAIIMVFPNLFFHFLCWNFVLKIAKISVTKVQILESLLIGFSFALITPGGIGESGRGLHFKRENNIHMVGLSFVDKFYGLFVTVILGLVGSLYHFSGFIPIFSFLLLIIISITALKPSVFGKIILKIISILPFYKSEARDFIHTLKEFSSKKALILLILASGYHFVFFTQFYFLLLACNADILFFDAVSIMALIAMIKAILPIAIGDIGLRENLAIYFLCREPYNIVSEIAFNASFMLFLINIALPSIFGLLFIPKLIFSKKSDGN